MARSALLLAVLSVCSLTVLGSSQEACVSGECSVGKTAGLGLLQTPAARARALQKVKVDTDAEEVKDDAPASQGNEAQLEEDAHAHELPEDDEPSLAEQDNEVINDDDHLASLTEETELVDLVDGEGEDHEQENEHEEDDHEEDEHDEDEHEEGDHEEEEHEEEGDDDHLASLAEDGEERGHEENEHEDDEHEDEHVQEEGEEGEDDEEDQENEEDDRDEDEDEDDEDEDDKDDEDEEDDEDENDEHEPEDQAQDKDETDNH